MRTASTLWGAAERPWYLQTVPSASKKPFGAFFHGRVWAAPGGAGGRRARAARLAAGLVWRPEGPPNRRPPRPAGSRPGRPRIIPAPGRWSRRNGQGGSKKNSGKGAEKPQDIARNTRLRGHFKKVGKMGKKGLQSGQISCNISIVARTRGRFRAQRAEGERPREVAGDCHPGNFRGRAHKTGQRA